MSAPWYCRIGNQQLGPLTTPELKQLVAAGQIRPDSPLRRGESGRWVTAGQMPGLFTGVKPAAAPARPPVRTQRPSAPPSARPPRAAAPPIPQGDIPVGKAVPSRPAPSDDVEQVAGLGKISVGEIPVGKAMGPAVAAVSPAGRRGIGSDDENRSRRKNGKPMAIAALATALVALALFWMPYVPIVLGLAAVGLAMLGLGDQTGSRTVFGMAVAGLMSGVLAAGVGGVATYRFANKNAAEAQTAQGEEDGETPGGDVSFGGDVPFDDETGTGDETAGSEPETSAADADAAPTVSDRDAKLVKSVRSWRNAANKTAGLRDLVAFKVTSVWTSDDPAGTRADAAQPAETSDADTDTADADMADADAPTAPAPPTGKYLFVQIELESRSSSGAVAYNSWNGAGDRGQFAAVLLDSSGNLCPLVPYSDSTVPGRKRATSIAPDGKATDTLVFYTPAGPFDYLRLALPYAVFGGKYAATPEPRGLGFEIPKSLINAALKPPKTAEGGAAGPGTGSGDAQDDADFDAVRRGIAESVGQDDDDGSLEDSSGEFTPPADDSDSGEFDSGDLLDSVRKSKGDGS